MAESIDLPLDYDEQVYKQKYQDIQHFSSKNLYIHYINHGIKEGRVASQVSTRESFVNLIDKNNSILEIGPFLNPMLRRPRFDVKYFDT